MLENLIYSQKKSLLTKELEAGNVPENAIAFIGDTKEIYAQGQYFGGSYTKEEIDEMFILSKYEFVDLGLPSGLKWATCNIGATKPEDFGLYFAWGETQGYTAEDIEKGVKQFNWKDYKWCNGSSNTLTKYNNDNSYGTVDNLTTLELSDDAAYVSDKTCRMPTKADFEELTANTTSTWETLNGVNGRRFTSKTNGNSIFVPAAGFCGSGSAYGVGSYGGLWSSSLGESNPRYGWCSDFFSGDVYVNYGRCNGFTVRAVQEANTKFNPSETVSKVNNIESQIGDINAALDYIINGPTFTILKRISSKFDGSITDYEYTFNFTKGMTWGEWVNSEYNTASDETIGDKINIGGAGTGTVSFGGKANVYLTQDKEVVVNQNDLIIENHQYYIPVTAGGSN